VTARTMPSRRRPVVIAFEFYDGPTRGILLLKGYPHYFQVIAWDEGQDSRLFAVSKIPTDLFRQVLRKTLRGGTTGKPNTSFRLFDFKSSSEQEREEWKDLVSRAKRSANRGTWELMIGTSPLKARGLNMRDTRSQQYIRARVNQNAIETLGSWQRGKR